MKPANHLSILMTVALVLSSSTTTTITTTLAFTAAVIPSKTLWQSSSSSPSSTSLFLSNNNNNNDSLDLPDQKKNILQYILDPIPTKIPSELKDEIYRAESQTPAAKERSARITGYIIVGLLCLVAGLLNVVLTEIRDIALEENGAGGGGGVLPAPSEVGWGWAESNPIIQFFVTTRVGGGVDFLVAGGAALLGEAENDVKRQNAEKIYVEMERRRQLREQGAKKKQKKKPKATSNAKGMAKQSRTQKKRMAALSEVLSEEEDAAAPNADTTEEKGDKGTMKAEESEADTANTASTTKDEGFMDKLKGWYEKADSMAASQALLLNKELEDRGVIDKITDESGLKVIGKEAAAKLKEEGGDGVAPDSKEAESAKKVDK